MLSLNSITKIGTGVVLLPFAAWYDLYSAFFVEDKPSLTETIVNNIKENLCKKKV